jgi:lipoprotein-releasing system permease protein
MIDKYLKKQVSKFLNKIRQEIQSMSFEKFISRRYIRAKQGQTFISLITLLSVAGVAVGVMALIVVISVMSGFESDMKSRILGVESHIILTRQGGGFSDYRRIAEYLKTVDGIESATPFVETQTMVRTSRGLYGAVVRGIEPETAGNVIRSIQPATLAKLNKQDMPGVIFGKDLGMNAGISEGQGVYLISPRGMISPIGHIPTMKRFTAVGFFEAGMYEYDGSYLYIHLKEAQKLLQMEDTITGIEIRLTDIYKADKIGKKIIADLGKPYQTKDWMQKNRNFFSALKLEKTAMFVILTLIVLVAAFNIASSLIMMVMEKTRDIAILKAMGATDKTIQKIFVFQGMAIGAIGTSFGVIFGVTLCLLLKRYKFIELPSDVYYITTLPVQMQLTDVILIAISALLICFLATLYPANQAAKLNPIEAIRYG